MKLKKPPKELFNYMWYKVWGRKERSHRRHVKNVLGEFTDDDLLYEVLRRRGQQDLQNSDSIDCVFYLDEPHIMKPR